MLSWGWSFKSPEGSDTYVGVQHLILGGFSQAINNELGQWD